jgi:hypothetical protein
MHDAALMFCNCSPEPPTVLLAGMAICGTCTPCLCRAAAGNMKG